MRLTLAVLSICTLALAACDPAKTPTTSYKVPEYKPPKFDIPPLKLDVSGLDQFQTCQNPPKASDLTPEVKSHTLSARDTVEYQDVESINCAGKKTFKPKTVQKAFAPTLRLEPPATLQGAAASVEVENATTCVTRKAKLTRKLNDKHLQDLLWEVSQISLDDANVVQVRLNNATLKLASGLNVANGPNLLNLTYKDASGAEMAHTKVLVNVEVEERTVPGVKQVDDCKR